MMMTNKIFFVFLLWASAVSVMAQETEVPLSCNPVIREYVRKHDIRPASNLRIRQSPLQLPFLDDFSRPGIYPKTEFWTDSDAFINQTYCDNPVTLGVATLDGIDKYGNPYDSLSFSTQPIICDYLTSQPVDLTTVTASDSVYFSFYYQPQGHGDEPEDIDSLVLQFYANNAGDSAWTNIWSMTGSANQPFMEVRIKLDSAVYFWGGFQFRFYNYATPNGNRDHWNIDYVKLKANETYNEPLKEITLVNPIVSYLKDYTAMPYSHYKHEVAAGNNPVNTSINDSVRLYTFTGTTSLALNDTVWRRDGSFLFGAQSAPDLNPAQNTTDNFQITLPPQLFDTTSGDMTDFTVKHSFSGLQAGDSANDASYFTQHFYNYYAYDDGTAESATGVHVADTKMAYQIDVKKADSLLGIQIYFNPWGINVHQDDFNLCLWSSIDTVGNTATLVHQSFNNFPANNDSINGFIDYWFDEPQWVNAGICYIGIVQVAVDEIGLGVDHNTDSHEKMYVNYFNHWYRSGIQGSWMMRPIFGKKLTIGINEIGSGFSSAEVFPNPAWSSVTIRNHQRGISKIEIYNLVGELVLQSNGNSKNPSGEITLDVSALPGGVYTVRMLDVLQGLPATGKLIIQH